MSARVFFFTRSIASDGVEMYNQPTEDVRAPAHLKNDDVSASYISGAETMEGKQYSHPKFNVVDFQS